MKYLPLMHNFSGCHCLVAGGGKVALRRARRVLDAGGRVDVIAVQCLPELNEIILASNGSVRLGPWRSSDLERHYKLVVAATNDKEVNRQIAEDSKRHGIPVNVVDDSSLCDVIFPTVINREPTQIAISSGSASPQFANLLRRRINLFIPSGYGRLADLFGRYRQQINRRIKHPGERKSFWDKVVHGHIAESALSGNIELAESRLQAAIDDHRGFSDCGEVYLIGAGPGDPDLLTLRAFRLLQQAEIVIYDRLVSKETLDRLEEGKELIYVGKQRSKHTLPQTQINDLLVQYARQGKRVARLKGGDPFIFGRGGEEIEKLAENHIPFQIIPGITAATGCASYAGIPLTHRDHAQSVRFVTGQLQNGSVNLDWGSLIAREQTLVFYMALQGLPTICKQLIAHGCSPDTLAAVIEKGTTPEQRVYISALEKLPAVIAKSNIQAPTLTIVGSVVSLHSKLGWFNR